MALDLTAEPLPRWKLDLLWVGPSLLQELRILATMAGEGKAAFQTIGEGEEEARVARLAERVASRQITIADIDWAIGVDSIAGEAERLAGDEDRFGAITQYRAALRQAPGCDVYLLSIGVCLFHLGAARDAVTYMQRAHEIDPANSRIRRNLEGLCEHLGLPPPR